MSLDTLMTPAALVDLDRVERNTRTMAERAHRLGVRLRPHVKTHACVEIARLQVQGHFGGVTVSTFAEARRFADAGFTDLTHAVPLAVGRLPEAAELTQRLERFSVLVDGPETVAAIEDCARERDVRFSVFLKVDCGYHRAGVDPADPDSARLAAALAASEHVDFRGLLTHAGHSYHCHDRDEVAVVAAQERDVIVAFAERLRADGVTVPEVSVGSTPTCSVVDDLTGVTEIRPGNNVFFDRFQRTIGSCDDDGPAFFVLTTVIARHSGRRQVLLDAGALALSKDAGASHVDPDAGYGELQDLDGRPLPGLRLHALSQEHGQVEAAPGVELPAVGQRLRVLPNHSCLSAACFRSYQVVRGREPVAEWDAPRGW
ncbi:MAG: alanine racemase [Acidobacteriota bacterium]